MPTTTDTAIRTHHLNSLSPDVDGFLVVSCSECGPLMECGPLDRRQPDWPYAAQVWGDHQAAVAVAGAAPPADPLEAAYQMLARRHLAACDGSGEDTALLAALVDVVDHARRIALPTASAHYRADKAGPLLDAALRLQVETMWTYAVGASAFDPAVVEQDLADIDAHLTATRRKLEGLYRAARAVMWGIARRGAADESSAQQLRLAVGDLARWSAALVAGSLPDEEG